MVIKILQQSVVDNLAQIVPEFTEEEIAAATQTTNSGNNQIYVYIAIGTALAAIALLLIVNKLRKSKNN